MSGSPGVDEPHACSTPESPQTRQTYTCEICDAKLSRQTHLQRHMKLHSRGDAETFACQLCGKSFNRKDVYQRHKRSVHRPARATRPTSKRKSCRRCIRYKLRCSREMPCEGCLNRGVVCSYDPGGSVAVPQANGLRDVNESTIQLSLGNENHGEETEWPMPTLNDLTIAAHIIDSMQSGTATKQFPAASDDTFAQSTPSISGGHEVDPGTTAYTMDQDDTFLNSSQHEFSGLHTAIGNTEFIGSHSQQVHLDLGRTDLAADQFEVCDWDTLRSSRMDWLGCETEVSDAGLSLTKSHELLDNTSGQNHYNSVSLETTGGRDGDNKKTWPEVLDRGGNETWPFDYTSNKGFRKIMLPPLRQVLEQTVGDRPAIEKSTLMDLIKVLSAPQIPCLNDTPALEALPAVAFLGEFVKVYFAEFHFVYPIIHMPTWRIEKCPTALLAAMACIGATYSTAEGSQEVAALLAEITQRALFWMGQADSTAFRNSSYITASCFHQLYALGSGNRRLYELADASRGLLVTSLRGLGVLSSDAEQVEPFAVDLEQLKRMDLATLQATWLQWRDKEMEKRMAWSVFEFDCTLATLTSKRGAFRIAELPSRLPCSESIWEAHSARAWAAILPFAATAPSGLPFYPLLRDIIAQKPVPDSIPAWAKRLCVHAIGRMLHDIRETEDASAANNLGLNYLAAAHEETKTNLLAAMTSLQRSLSQPTCTADIVNMKYVIALLSPFPWILKRILTEPYSIGSLSTHHAHLSNGHEAMDLIIYIFRNSGRDSPPQEARELKVAKEHLRLVFGRDPTSTRRSVYHAASIVSIARECTINTPCETMRVFMGFAFLLSFARFFPFQTLAAVDSSSKVESRAPEDMGAVYLDNDDTSHWTRTMEGLDQIENWTVHDICDGRNFVKLKEMALKTMKGLRVWGLASKFRRTISNFN